jgi:hypothetical protein
MRQRLEGVISMALAGGIGQLPAFWQRPEKYVTQAAAL